MKKLLILAAAAALLLASCAKVETNNTRAVDDNIPIAFSNYSPRSITKAGATYVTGNTLIEDEKFAVMAYSTANGTAFATNAIGTNFMDKVAVQWKNNSNNGANNPYSPVRYWPTGDNPSWLTFWGYYPVIEDTGGVAKNTKATNNGIAYTVPDGSNGLGTFDFEVQDAAANMVDFMVSDVVDNKHTYVETTKGEVPMLFKHMLTRVQFYFKTDKPDSDGYTDIILKTVTLSNVFTKGILSAGYNASENPKTSTTWGSWAKHDTPIVFSIVNSNDGSFILQEAKSMTPNKTAVSLEGSSPSFTYPTTYGTGYPDTDNVYLMIPQTFGTDANQTNATISFTYDIKTYNTATAADHIPANLLSSSENSATVNMKDIYLTDDSAKITQWSKNNIVTYTFIIGPRPIRFTATADSWTPDVQGEHTL